MNQASLTVWRWITCVSASNRRKLLQRTLVLLLAALLLTQSLAHYERFHPDEAFFMTFARGAAVNGDWLLPGSLDKPPLSIYLNAVGLMLFAVDADANGVLYLDVYQGEFAARVTGVLQGVLLVALMMTVAKHLRIADDYPLFVGLLLALSPYLIAFAPTAFTDVPMLLCGALAWLLALRGRGVWAGVAWALSFAAKPQAVFLLPLILLSLPRRCTLGFSMMCVPGAALLLLWDAARPENSVFLLGASNNTPDNLLVPLVEWPERVGAWWGHVRWLFGDGLTTPVVLLLGVAALFAVNVRPKRTLLLCLLWLLGYALLHIVLRINIYDRYVLLALLPTVLVAALGLMAFSRSQPVLGIVIIVAMAITSWQTATGKLFIGGDRGQYDGINQLATELNAKPVATVIYDRWLGWQLGYYMGQWSDKRRVYYPTPDELATGAAKLKENGTRYLVAPSYIRVDEWLAALRSVGFTIRQDPQIRVEGYQVYALTPP